MSNLLDGRYIPGSVATPIVEVGLLLHTEPMLLRFEGEKRVDENFDAAIRVLNGQGHVVRPYIRQGRLWFEINGNMLVTRQEMLELADGVYSLEELLELTALRRNEQGS